MFAKYGETSSAKTGEIFLKKVLRWDTKHVTRMKSVQIYILKTCLLGIEKVLEEWLKLAWKKKCFKAMN